MAIASERQTKGRNVQLAIGKSMEIYVKTVSEKGWNGGKNGIGLAKNGS